MALPSDTPRSATRYRNRLEVLDALRVRGTASRADLARTTGLARSTISAVIAELLADGLVVDRDERQRAGAQGGRPGALLSLDRAAGVAMSVAIGRAQVRVLVANLSAEVLAEATTPIEIDGPAGPVLDGAAMLAHDALDAAGVGPQAIVGLAVGMPGLIERATGTVRCRALLPAWEHVRPADALAARLGAPCPVVLEDDVSLATLGEARFGAGDGATDLVYVRVGATISAGLVLGGRMHRGAAGVAGELGHVHADPSGAACRCGNRGCLETVAAAGPLLAKLGLSAASGRGPQQLAALVASGDHAASEAVRDAGRAVGRAVADLTNVLVPARVIVGGELGGVGTPLLDGVRASMDEFVLPCVRGGVELIGGTLGERAELLGGLARAIEVAAPLRAGRHTAAR